MTPLRTLVAFLLCALAAHADWAESRAAFEEGWKGTPGDRRVAVRKLEGADHADGLLMLYGCWREERDPDVKVALTEAIGRLVSAGAGAALQDAVLGDETADGRMRSCALLKGAGVPNRLVILCGLIRDEDPGVRARALRTLAPADAALADEAGWALADESAEVRMAAAQALGEVRAREEAERAIRALEAEPVGEVRWAIGRALELTSGKDLREEAAAWRAWWAVERTRANNPPPPSVGAGAAAPEFRGAGLDRRAVSLADFAGRTVLLHFWSTESGARAMRLDLLKAARDAFHDEGFEIVGVCVDADARAAAAFAEENGMTWPVIGSGAALAAQYRVREHPRALLIGPDRVVRNDWVQPFALAREVAAAVRGPADLAPATPAATRDFVPNVALGNWWLVHHRRAGERTTEELLLWFVTGVGSEGVEVAVTSSSGWSFVLELDGTTWSARGIAPAHVKWIEDRRAFALAIERERAVSLDGPVSLAFFRDYPAFDAVFHAFPSGPTGTLAALTEDPAGPTAVEKLDLECRCALGDDGRLRADYRADFGEHRFRLEQEWERGLPFPVHSTYANSHAKSGGTLTLLRAGAAVRDLFALPVVATAAELKELLPARRLNARDVLAEQAVLAACRVLRPDGQAPQLPSSGKAGWRRGDLLRVGWEILPLPVTESAPQTPQNRVHIPTDGSFLLACADVRSVGGEDLVFVQAFGADTSAWSYEPARGRPAGLTPESLAGLLENSPASTFSNPDYWTNPTDPDGRWDRVSFLRRRPARALSESAADARAPTQWILAFRRKDLFLRGIFGYHLDARLRARPFTVSQIFTDVGPVAVRQSLQLLRPQDWMLLQAFAGLGGRRSNGAVLRLSPTDPETFRAERLAEEALGTHLLKGMKFFEKFAALPKVGGRLNVTQTDLSKLEGGLTTGGLTGLLRRMEAGTLRKTWRTTRTMDTAGFTAYHLWGGKYPWWKESLVCPWNENYLAHLKLLTPPARVKPGG
ncbi:MAG: redoxin domain-containing protein [Planctomycetes bacterium]|nr:redoxin domain-containing protein [Planctomycetota bacterium]